MVLSWFYMAIPVGSALGYVLGGTVAHSSLGWRWAFYLAVVPGILSALGCLLMEEPPRGGADATEVAVTRRLAWKDYGILRRTPSYVLCTLGMTAMTFAIGGISVWMPFYLERSGDQPGLGKDPTSIFGAIIAGSGLIATLLGGMTADRLRTKLRGSYFIVSGLAMLAGFPLYIAFFFAPFPLAWVLLFFASFCLFFNTGPTNTILANVTHPAIRASAFAVNIFIIHALGDVLSPMVIGLLGDKFSMRTALLGMSAMFLVSAGFWLAGSRHLAQDTEMANSRLNAD
jgi:MFS family permease